MNRPSKKVTTTSRMGSWRNPPLAYVVAEVRFSPYLTIERHVPDFQADIRKQFPRTLEANILRFALAGGQPGAVQDKAWRFFTESQRIGIDLSARGIALHATEYKNFEVFRETVTLMLEATEKAIPDLLVEQLGLRYIDYILPAKDETGSDYLVESLRGVQPPSAPVADQAYYIAHFPFQNGGVNIRVMPRLPSGTHLPPNFGPIEIAPGETMIEAQRRAQNQEIIGCIDTDRMMPIGKKLVANQLTEAFSSMHTDISTFFNAAISEKARKAWK
jgi:uncharacterized protein (TIGR04255 family)